MCENAGVMPPVAPALLPLPSAFAAAGPLPPVLLLGFGGFLLLLGGCVLLAVFLCFDHCLGAAHRATPAGESPADDRPDPFVLGATQPVTRCHRPQSAEAAGPSPAGRLRDAAPGAEAARRRLS